MKEKAFFIPLVHLLLCAGCSSSTIGGMAKQYVYSYEAESIGYSDIKKMYSTDSTKQRQNFFESGSLQTLEIKLKCDIKKTITKINSKGSLFCYELQAPSLSIINGGVAANVQDIQQELQRPVFVETNEQGVVGIVQTDSTNSSITTGLIKEVISEMQFVSPQNKAATWQATEENTTGTYTANYELAHTDSAVTTYKKSIGNYIKLRLPAPGQKIAADCSSFFSIGTDGAIKQINTSQAQFVKISSDTVSAIATKVAVVLKQENNAADKDLSAMRSMAASPLYQNGSSLGAAMSAEKITALAYMGTLKNDTWESLLAKLDGATTIETADSLVLQFRALFYLFPQNCTNAVLVLSDADMNTSRFRVLSNALSITNSEPASNAMAAIIEKRSTDEKIMAIFLPALAVTDFPTPASAEIIKRLAFSAAEQGFISSTAQLTLGGMANHLRQRDSAGAAVLTNYLVSRMAMEKDTVQKILVLSNTGSHDAFEICKAFINSENVSTAMKLEAVAATRPFHEPEAIIFLQQLVNSADTSIRKAAGEVLRLKELDKFN